MSNYDEFENINGTDTQDPLSPPRIPDNDGAYNAQNTSLTPNSALPIVKNRIFKNRIISEMYGIHTKNDNHQNK